MVDEAQDRADREIDAAGDDDEGHGESDETDCRHQPSLIEQISGGEERIGLQCEQDRSASDQQKAENGLMAQNEAKSRVMGRLRCAGISASTVARM